MSLTVGCKGREWPEAKWFCIEGITWIGKKRDEGARGGAHFRFTSTLRAEWIE